MKRKRAPVRTLALALQGTPAETPPTGEAIPALSAVLKILSGYFRMRGG